MTTQPASAAVSPLDVTDPAFRADPFPTYARLRAATPVVHVDVPGEGRVALITRYDDVERALVDDRLVKNPREALTSAQLRRVRTPPRALAPLERNLLSLDGADHARLRALVSKAFTPRRVELMRADIDTLTHELLDAVAARGEMDLIADFALPLPLTIIARIIGVPPSDHHRFTRWMRHFTALPDARNPLPHLVPLVRFVRYLRRLVAQRTATPTDDLVSALALARDGDDRLTDDEIVAMVFLLLSAGHETTVNLIGTGVLALLDHPTQARRMRDDSDLVRTGIEELLRFVVPAEMATPRYARTDLDIAGVRIHQGTIVYAVLGSANRDRTQFQDPDVLDLARHPNRHLSFGRGSHYCIGAPLSRLEAQIAIPTLLRRLPNLRLAVSRDHVRWRGGLVLRGVTSLPVAW